MKNRFSLHVLALLTPALMLTTVVGCGSGDGGPATSSDSPKPIAAVAPTAEPPSMDELSNAIFTGILDNPVQLTDGSWQGEPFVEGGVSAPAVGLVQSFHLSADLTGDGASEAVVLLWTSSGGSGTFDHMAVVGHTADGISTLGTAELGDRVQVREGRIANGQIAIDVVQAGEEDAACCPTELATRTWTMEPGGLTEVSTAVTGTLSLAVLLGPEWVLTEFAWDEPALAEPEVTLVFEEGRVAGSAGCNGYFGGIEEDTDMPGRVSLGHLGATRKMCPEEIMAVEGRFLRQLSGVSSYSFLAGKLALSWQADASGGVMLLAPREPSAALEKE